MQTAEQALKEYLAQLEKDNSVPVRAEGEEREAAAALKRKLKIGALHHTMSIAQLVGVYPA